MFARNSPRRPLASLRKSGVLLRHPIVSLTVMLAFTGGPLALWYTHTHPLQRTEVCSYRSYRQTTRSGIQPIIVHVPVYCDRPAGG